MISHKKFFESNNNYLEENVIVERIIYNSNKIIKHLSKCNFTFDENDINIHCNSMDKPEIGTQSIVDFANMDFQTGQIIPFHTRRNFIFH